MSALASVGPPSNAVMSATGEELGPAFREPHEEVGRQPEQVVRQVGPLHHPAQEGAQLDQVRGGGEDAPELHRYRSARAVLQVRELKHRRDAAGRQHVRGDQQTVDIVLVHHREAGHRGRLHLLADGEAEFAAELPGPDDPQRERGSPVVPELLLSPHLRQEPGGGIPPYGPGRDAAVAPREVGREGDEGYPVGPLARGQECPHPFGRGHAVGGQGGQGGERVAHASGTTRNPCSAKCRSNVNTVSICSSCMRAMLTQSTKLSQRRPAASHASSPRACRSASTQAMSRPGTTRSRNARAALNPSRACRRRLSPPLRGRWSRG